MADKKTVSKIIFKNVRGVDVEIAAGGGVAPDVPLPRNVVTSDAIQDGAVKIEDINPEAFASTTDISEMFRDN